MKCKIIVVTLVLIHFATASASAGPVLIYSIDIHGSPGHAPETEQRVEFFLELRPADSDPPGVRLGEGIFWKEGEQGIVDFNAQNTSSFPDFTELATNGMDDRYLQYTVWPSGRGGAAGGSESRLFAARLDKGEPPDLVGFRVDLVRLIVRSVDFEPWPLPDGDGFKVTYDLAYEFFGSPIPEPSMIVLLTIGSCRFMGRGFVVRTLEQKTILRRLQG